MNELLDERDRKEIFVRLVGLQDEGHSVESSRGEIANYYGIGVAAVLSIEQEGIQKSWPPLEDSS